MYVDGSWREGADRSKIEIENPATEQIIGSVPVERANDTAYGLSAYLFTSNYRQLSNAPYLLKFGELYINRSNGEGVQGFHSGWGLSGIGGEDGKYGFDGYLRKQTAYSSWS